MFGNIGRNVRLGLRRLMHTPGFTSIAIVSLGLAIGANVGVFSMLRQSILRPVPVNHPEDLVAVFMSDTISPGNLEVSRPNFRDLKQQSTNVFADLAAYDYLPLLVEQGQNPERLRGALVTGNYFQMLGVQPYLGRVFRPDEDAVPGVSPNVILSNEFWISHYGRDDHVIGKALSINKHPFVIAGVLPPRFNGTEVGPPIDLWLPLNMYQQADPDPDWYDARRALALMVLGRLRPGVSFIQAQTEATAIGTALQQEYATDNRHRNFVVLPYLTARLNVRGAADLSHTLRILTIIVGLILLIGCSNVALQLLVRHTRRSRTMAIQKVVGATQVVLIREWMTEVLLLCLGGALAGLLLSFICLRLAPNLMPVNTGPMLDYGLDYHAVDLALILAVLSTFICGVIPLTAAEKINLVDSLKQQASSWNSRGNLPSMKKILISLEIICCMVPLINAGLLIRSLNNAWSIDPGFRSDHILIMNLDLGLLGYDEPHLKNFYTQVVDKVEAVPGVKNAVIVRYPPLAPGMRRSIFLEGQDESQGRNGQLVRTNVVGLNYFNVVGIPLIEGREFLETDKEDTPNVIVINEKMAQTFWPNQSAIGKRLRLFGEQGYRQVVGVVKNSKVDSITESPVPYIYLPLKQFLASAVTLFVYTTGDPNSYAGQVQGLLSGIDSSLRAFNVRSMSTQIKNSLSGSTRVLSLLSILGLLGLLLAGSGIYGVVSQMVADKYREIGIRIALGASRFNIVSMLLREAMTPVFIGAVVGALVARWLSGILSSSLFGISLADPLTYGATILLLILTCLIACIGPTKDAVKINPVSMMKSE